MRLLPWLLILSLPLWPAEVHKRPAAPVANAHAKALPDAEIERNIRERFAKSKSAGDKFQVHVRGGVATIEGRTDVIQRKASATRMAKTGGARQVINKIEISDAARQKANNNLAQGRRRAQVKRSEVSKR